jgi:DNA-binding CsgD family transcriptional regulator
MQGAIATFAGLESLPASAAILDRSGRIVAVNGMWKEFGRRNGLRVPHSAIGAHYLQYCRSDAADSRRFARELRALLAGKLDLLTLIYPCHSPTQERWFCLVGLPLSLDQPAGVALLHVNLTDMLPLRVPMRRRQGKEDHGRQLRAASDFRALSGAVERSVSESLSSQLNAMLTDPRHAAREKDAHGDTDPVNLVRARLSKRQMQVLHLLGQGKTNKEMARALVLSPNTIKLHVSAILQRLKLRSRTHAALLSSRLKEQSWADLIGEGLNDRPAGRHRRDLDSGAPEDTQNS